VFFRFLDSGFGTGNILKNQETWKRKVVHRCFQALRRRFLNVTFPSFSGKEFAESISHENF